MKREPLISLSHDQHQGQIAAAGRGLGLNTAQQEQVSGKQQPRLKHTSDDWTAWALSTWLGRKWVTVPQRSRVTFIPDA